MLIEQIEAFKSLSRNDYYGLIKDIDIGSTHEPEMLISLFVVSIIHSDANVYHSLKEKVETLEEIKSVEYQYYYEIGQGLYCYQIKDYNETLKHYVKATTIAYDLESSSLIADSNRFMSIVYRKMGDLEQAIYYIERAIRILNDVDRPIIYANVYMTYGLILVDTKSLSHARKIYESAVDVFKSIDGYSKHMNYKLLLFNLNELCEIMGDYESANYYFAEASSNSFGDDHRIYDNLMAKSKSKQCKRQGLYLEALEHLEKYIDDMSTENRSDLDHNKDEIQVNFEQIEDLKVKNKSLLNRMNQMYETIESTNDSMISFELEEKINHALINDFIKPYFQLKWSVEKKRFIGAEALMRWIDGDTFVPPNQFIYDVENSSIIMKMSEKIIRESFKFCKKVLDDIQDEFVISINISPYQLAHQDLAKLMRNELLLHNLEGRHVEIEITERSFIEQNPKILEELYALSELGIRIALDDFGTGYSSLSCVNDFPIDVIKIDRSLVSNIESGDKSAKLLAGIIRMMKELELETVAEGVENEVQANMLMKLGCDCIQGYYYAKPESECDVINRLKTYVTT